MVKATIDATWERVKSMLSHRIVFTFANVDLLGVALQPPSHRVKATLDARWERVKSMLSMH